MAVKAIDDITTITGSIPSTEPIVIESNNASMDDGGASHNIRTTNPETTAEDLSERNGDISTSIYHSANLRTRNELKRDLFNKTYRFGVLNPYGALSTAREYLFFTKPDLHIMEMTYGRVPSTTNLNGILKTIPFWVELQKYRPQIIKSLQYSCHKDDPFIHLLQNQVISNLDVPGLQAEFVDTPTNMFGVGFSYRGSSEASDDNPEFSLEFRDNRWLDTYTFFKAYEEYETLKHHGTIAPAQYYIEHKILHDQFSIYKFLVDDDMETIVYYGKYFGVTPRSLPREVFSNTTFDSGLSYSVDFKAAFYEDMKPEILSDFNALAANLANSQKYDIRPHNPVLDRPDNRPAVVAYVEVDTTSPAAIQSSGGRIYKLRWRGSDRL